MAVINTNILALTAQTNMNRSASALGTAIERLSSGLRINSAKDDAAGQAIANRMNAQVRGMGQAQRNANDGISLLQTQESGLGEINSNLQRIRELSVQAASDTNTADDRASIQTEIDQRVEEIDRIANGSTFNGTQLLNVNGGGSLNIQVGAGTTANDSIAVATLDATSGTLFGAAVITVEDTAAGDGSAAANAKLTITAVDAAIEKIDTARSEIGAKQNRFESTVNNLANTITNLSAAKSRIEDADYAAEVSNMTRGQILQQAGQSVLAQANQIPQGVLSLLR